MKELDIKQLNEINDIESFFGIKGLKKDNVETKAMISINFIELNELFICKHFINNSECNYGDKVEKICREFVDSLYVRILLTNSYLMEM
jgi:hypothetical protein